MIRNPQLEINYREKDKMKVLGVLGKIDPKEIIEDTPTKTVIETAGYIDKIKGKLMVVRKNENSIRLKSNKNVNPGYDWELVGKDYVKWVGDMSIDEVFEKEKKIEVIYRIIT